MLRKPELPTAYEAALLTAEPDVDVQSVATPGTARTSTGSINKAADAACSLPDI